MNDDEMEAEEESMPVNSNHSNNVALVQNQPITMDDDDDGPVIVPYDQVESSLSRSAAAILTTRVETTEEAKHRQSYPLLYAAMSQAEDVVMCAARILDEKKDVSLVREAAAGAGQRDLRGGAPGLGRLHRRERGHRTCSRSQKALDKSE